jgi:Flp pilus assembly protein TadD
MPGETNDKGWILHSHGQGRRFGPLSEDELRGYFRAGMVKSVDRLSPPGSLEKHAAADVASALGEAVPLGPPPPPEGGEAVAPRLPPAAANAPSMRPATSSESEERAARAAAALNIDLATMMASSVPAKQRSGWIGPVLVVVLMVVMMFVGLSMVRKLKPQPGAPGAPAQAAPAAAVSGVVTPPPGSAPAAESLGGARAIPVVAAPAAGSSVDMEQLQAKAEALKASNDWSGLASHAAKWAQAQPERNEPLEYQGVAFAGLGDLAQAEAAFKKVLARAPADTVARSMLAQVYEQAQRYPEAAEQYKQLVMAKPNDAAAWNNYGAALSGANQQAQAAVALENAVRLDPSMKQAWTNLGNLYQAMGNASKAQAAFANAR